MRNPRDRTELVEAARLALENRLSDIPFVAVEHVESRSSSQGAGPDLLAALQIADSEKWMVACVNPSGEPRWARQAVDLLKRYRRLTPDAYGLFIAPFISAAAGEICKQAGIGYLDLSGNCRIGFDMVYIRIEGHPNRFAVRREIINMYTPRSERVLRVLMSHPHREWKLQDLAKEAEISLGQTHNVKERLLDREWLDSHDHRWVLNAPFALLADWAAHHSHRRSSSLDLYSSLPLPDLEAQLAAACTDRGIRYAFTGISGASRVAPFGRYQRTAVYIEEREDEVIRALGLRKVSSEANLSVLTPYDGGVYYGAIEAPVVFHRGNYTAICVSPTQMYLDLRSQGGRGDEVAEYILENIIKLQW